eukprot:COSAG02_NODE_46842_length_345_cov_1.467480_1_plen_89_part_00
MLAGIVTRKNLMTFTLDDSSRTLKVHAMLRGWLVRDRLRRGCDPDSGVKLHAEAAEKSKRILDNLQAIRTRFINANEAAERTAGPANP